MASVFESWPDDALASSLIELYFIHANETLPLLQKAHFLRSVLPSPRELVDLACAGELTAGGLPSLQTVRDPTLLPRRRVREDLPARVCNRLGLQQRPPRAGHQRGRRLRTGHLGRMEVRMLAPVCTVRVRELNSLSLVSYYHAFQRIARSPLNLPALADLQLAVLHASFLQVHGARATRAWPVIGVGLKVAVELGAHRRGATRSKDAHDNELMRRAFWWSVPPSSQSDP